MASFASPREADLPEDIGFSDLIASSIHDMKNSLSVLVGALERMAVQCRDKGETALYDDLGRITYESSRLNLNLVELLSLYKLGRKRYPVDMEECKLCDLLEEALLQNRFMLDFKGLQVSTDCPEDAFWYVDRELVKGILTNALSNAYRYTRDAIHLSARVDGGWLELRVEDNGAGYPPAMLTQQAVDTERPVNFSTGSTGLGFLFAEQVAQLHKNGSKRGALSIENGGTLGGGCFVLRLP